MGRAMRNLYKKDDLVYEFEQDGSQNHLITDQHVLMTIEEINQHINPQDYMSEEEKLSYKRSQYPKLTRYQFMRGLLEMGFKSSDIEAQIMLIEDEYIRELTMIGFKDATNFVRTDPSIDVMRDMLVKTDLEIDEFWEFALNL